MKMVMNYIVFFSLKPTDMFLDEVNFSRIFLKAINNCHLQFYEEEKCYIVIALLVIVLKVFEMTMLNLNQTYDLLLQFFQMIQCKAEMQRLLHYLRYIV